MRTVLLILFILGLFVLFFAALVKFVSRRKKLLVVPPIPDEYKTILEKDVAFYQALNDDNKIHFEKRLMRFLATTRITGVNTEVEAEDRVYIAASAIIPIFGFVG